MTFVATGGDGAPYNPEVPTRKALMVGACVRPSASARPRLPASPSQMCLSLTLRPPPQARMGELIPTLTLRPQRLAAHSKQMATLQAKILPFLLA